MLTQKSLDPVKALRLKIGLVDDPQAAAGELPQRDAKQVRLNNGSRRSKGLRDGVARLEDMLGLAKYD